MGDLDNKFPSWGETGAFPTDGFFYDGGDQVNEKHLDALWNGIDNHISQINTAVRDRVRDLDGNVVFGTGLVASTGGGTREVDVTSASNAYVDGERTGSISSQTVTHSTNGTGSTRTDVVYVDKAGTVKKSEDTSTVPNNELKIAEVDVTTSDTINDVRNYARDHAIHVASENQPSSAEPGDIWLDHSTDRLKSYVNGAYKDVAVDGETGSTFTFEDNIDVNGTINMSNSSAIQDAGSNAISFDGSANVTLGGSLTLGSDLTATGGETIWDETATEIPDSAMGTVAAGTLNLGATVESNSGSLDVDESHDFTFTADIDLNGGATLSGTLSMGGNAIDNAGNIDINEGSAIRDDGGTNRVEVSSDFTIINDESGNEAFSANAGNEYLISARSSEPLKIYDREQGGVGVQYDTDATAGKGMLRTPNAGVLVQGSPSFSNAGVGVSYSSGRGTIRARDWANSTDKDLNLSGSNVVVNATGGLIDLTNGGFTSADLRLATGQSIEDGSGAKRFTAQSARTRVHNDVGDKAIDLDGDTIHRYHAYSGVPLDIYDNEQNSPGVQYDTDASAGVLRTPNAGFRAEADGSAGSGSGVEIGWQSGSVRGVVRAWDRTNGNPEELSIRGDIVEIDADTRIDASVGTKVNLRLATDQSIEDGSGTNRIHLDNSYTRILDEAGTQRITADSDGALLFNVPSGERFRIYDDGGDAEGLAYYASDTLPGTLELTNAVLDDKNGNRLLDSVAATGEVTLSGGTAIVDTGISATDATFQLALGIDDPNADAKVSGRIFWDDSAGTYKVEIVESTSVDPTVNYDVVRVR